MRTVATPGVLTNGASGHARYTFRLRVSSTALALLEGEWARCRWVWNEGVAVSRRVHSLNRAATKKITCGPAQLDRMLTAARNSMAWLREGSSVPQQQIIRDCSRSRAKALKDVREGIPVGQRAGMPRAKRKRESLPSLNYTKRGFRVRDGRLHLAGGIIVTVVWSRALAAQPSPVRVYRDSLGHRYASFVVPAEVVSVAATGRAIGIDWGVAETATTTGDDHDLPHAEYGKAAVPGLVPYQRQMARRRTAGNRRDTRGYRKVRRAAARVSKKTARQRQDTARKAADAAIGTAKAALVEMSRKHGRVLHLIHPAHTTMDCAQCGARAKHALPLSERVYSCTACGALSPRDKDSARVMLVRAGFNPAGADLVRPAAR